MEPSQPTSTGFGLVAVVILVLANAFFVATEFSLVSARKTRLDEMIRAGNRKATLARRAIQSLARYISATQLGITLTSLGLGWVGEPAVAQLLHGAFASLPPVLSAVTTHTIASIIAFTLITMLHITFGELVPKAVALVHPEVVASWTAPVLIGFAWVMAGPIAVLKGISNRVLALAGIKPPGEEDRLHSPEEIRMLVEQSEEGGTLLKGDARMLEGVFEFSEKTAQEVMTPRTQMIGLAADIDIEAAADEVAAERRSRYPVYTDSLDEIVGVVHAKDVLTALRSRPKETVRSIMRPPLFVPGTREVEDVLADMKRLKVHLAIVLDEYGGTAGLVTMEDLLEEIVGPIFDEHDLTQERPRPVEGAPLVDGAMPITDFNSDYDTSLDDTDYTTLGGYVFGLLGRLPRVGDRVTVGSHTFEVAEMDGRRVKALRVVAIRPEEKPA
ncbi:MAG TPA: hemolysin family protein [Gemmatimonadales bacterium]|jgi:CBS domain containing-hemolysin-like protein|nr:hemolysin family protein [Gemmatimonadales bacterium]